MPKQHWHLPDIPNAGYATDREKRLSDSIQEFMRQIERDRARLLTIVLGGLEQWRRVAGDIWRVYRIGEDHQLLDAIFHYFELQVCRSKTQRLLLKAHGNPQKWREIMRIVTPHLEKELEQVRLTQKWSPFDAVN